ncbi:MAG: hypothetical protein AAGF83_11650 [Cyanobacteria bacterium P01_G01_bin.67]
MSDEISTPKKIWIITEESHPQEVISGARNSSNDTGGLLREESSEVREVVTRDRQPVEVERLKQEMKGFLQAMREMLDEADPPESKMRLDEVELSVEINGEGQVSLFGVGGKAGGKGGMTFKFKRK